MRIPCIFLILSICLIVKAQNNTPDYYRENYLRYTDHVYVPEIKTVQLYTEGFELSDPLLRLNGDAKLLLAFDDLRADQRTYKYTFIHCDADWNPTNIRPFDYLEGFEEDYITDYRFSFNTLQAYTHYELVFPCDNMKIKRSGNYLLLVFPENERENPILSRRFFVVDNKVRVDALIRRATDIDDRNTKQEVRFSIFSPSFNLVNPYRNLRVVIRQNGRWDNAITTLKPQLVKGSELDYQYDAGNTFSAGNEFRRFDTKSIKYPSEYVQSMESGREFYEAWLKAGEKRAYKVYVSEDDINGRFFIKTLDGDDPATEGDYLRVHFRLSYPAEATNGNFYVLGELSGWQYPKDAMMSWDAADKAYKLTLFLKQGYYNYQYVFLENGKKTGDETLIEGSHFETENEYSIYVYYTEPGTDYVQLIAAENYNSRGKK